MPSVTVAPADRLGAVAPPLAETTLADADLRNVIVLSHRRHGADPEAPPVSVNDNERPAPDAAIRDKHLPLTALLSGVLLLHLVVILFLLRDPPPLASVGLESISVEIVLGAQTQAGLATTPSESESVPSQAAPETAPVETETEVAEKAPDTPQAVTEPEKAEQQPEPQQQSADMQAAIVTNEQVTQREPEKPRPVEKPRETKKPEPKRTAAAAPASASSSGIGVGSSSRERNYPGEVAAHLARHKRYPQAARATGARGTATVRFAIDGGGRVTSVQLVRSSGVPSLDEETSAMVRRASPFPAPPTGVAMNFTVPVNFDLR